MLAVVLRNRKRGEVDIVDTAKVDGDHRVSIVPRSAAERSAATDLAEKVVVQLLVELKSNFQTPI